MTITLALVGAPNSGKTATFNALTGAKAKVANYSGVTVDKKLAAWLGDADVTILDLPGTYSLRTTSPDEQVTREVLLGQQQGEQPIDGIIALADATNLRLVGGHLALALQRFVPAGLLRGQKGVFLLQGGDAGIALQRDQ